MTAEFLAINVGDFVVTVKRTYHAVDVRCVTKVTPSMFSYDEPAWRLFAETSEMRTRTSRREDVVFAGSEDRARRLHDQLVSSFALYDDERSACRERLEIRNKKFIEAVSAAVAA